MEQLRSAFAAGRVDQSLDPAWAVALGVVLVASGLLFAWKKTHINLLTRAFGEAAFPWKGWFRTVAIYWMPAMMLIVGVAMLTSGISDLR